MLESDETGLWPPRFPLGISKAWLRCWFHPMMITWLHACVSTASYSLNINGEAIGLFPGKKGLRQGDPLSSYLFVIVVEVLTCILREKASSLPDFKFHWSCGKDQIINLSFADDLMIFLQKGYSISLSCAYCFDGIQGFTG